MCKYYIVISDTLVGCFLDVLFLLLAVMLSELHVKLRRKDWVSKKIYREICVKGINFLTALTPFYVILCCFLCLLPSPSQVTFLLNGTHGWCSVMISWVNGRKYENLLPFYFSWLPALSSKAIYFLSIMSFSINKLKSHLLFTYKNLCFMILCGKKVLLQEMVRGRRGGAGTTLPPSPPFSTVLHRTEIPPSSFDQIWKQGEEISIFNLFSELGKIWKCNLCFSKIPISHLFYELGKTWKYTQPPTNNSIAKCWIYGWVGKTYVLI